MARIGLKDLYYAVITKNDLTNYTTQTPKLMGKVAGAKISRKNSQEKLYYDDKLDGVLNSTTEEELEIEIKELSRDIFAEIYGHAVVKGMLIEKQDNIIQDIAIGYRSKDENGKYAFKWHYCATCEPFAEDINTLAEKVKITNAKIKMSIRPRQKDGVSTISIDESVLQGADTDAKTLITPVGGKFPFFNSIPEPLS